MKAIKCEMCGSNDVVKEGDGLIESPKPGMDKTKGCYAATSVSSFL